MSNREIFMDWQWKKQWETANSEPKVNFVVWDSGDMRTSIVEAIRHVEWLDKRFEDWKKSRHGSR